MAANIHTETVTYDAAGTSMQSYLAYDAAQTGPRPGVLVVHEWWGLDDYIKGRCEMLAAMGYCALGVDMYGNGQTAANADEAGSLMTAVLSDIPAAEARFKTALQCLRGQASADAGKVAGIGYCFGGAMVLHAARIGLDLCAVVSFHGALGSFHKPAPGSVKASILVCHGAADALVPDEQIAGFKAEMDEAGADYDFKAYAGALHGFTNPGATANGEKFGLPLAYDKSVDEQSWADMQAFFGRIFA